MSLSDFDGFLENLTDVEMIKKTALAAGGGMFGASMYEIAVAKIKFLREGEDNVPLLKQIATRVGMTVVFAALFSESQPELAAGYVGGTMAGLGPELLRKFADELVEPVPLEGMYPLAARFSSKVQLQQLQGLNSTRTYSGEDIPAGVAGLSRVRVSNPDAGAMAALHSGGY